MTHKLQNIRRPVVLIIMDGVGVNPSAINNGFALAKTPCIDKYFSTYPLTLLQASGQAVGLPDGQMGNSEVGHLTIGCGDVVRQDLVAIDDAILSGQFAENVYLRNALHRTNDNKSDLHLVGLVSDGGVHSHIRHLIALIEMCRKQNVSPLLHMITDGRDTAPQSVLTYLDELNCALDKANGKIVSISGRYYAMDRDNNWDRIESAWQAIVNGQGKREDSAIDAVEASYAVGQTDEFIMPTVLSDHSRINEDDDVIFFNFRKDRARQLTASLFKSEFEHFDRGNFSPVNVTCMTEYDEWFGLPYAFKQDKPKTTLAQVISAAGIRQLHCAETEKYAHVTYFLNGGYGEAYEGEDRVIMPSPKVATYDLDPAMSAEGVAIEVCKAMETGQYGFIAVNFANGDMVGHTGLLQATIKAIEALDTQVGRVLDVALANNFSVILTADHGNCEQMVDFATGVPHTQHTVFPVPCMVMDEVHWQLSVGAGLSAIAPTVLQLMGINVPAEMSAHSLLLEEIKIAV